MPRTADIRDPAFRAALEKAEAQLDDGAYAQAAQTCVETYLELLARHPELLPADTPDLPRSAAGPNGVSSFDSARAIRRKWWPVTGAITVVLGPDRTPQVTH
ncbi:MAG: hypothetical protein JO057_14720, partial [Chloroflexi bacterium]|nr:hypothetical protein [Chloroflexota bacterium]